MRHSLVILSRLWLVLAGILLSGVIAGCTYYFSSAARALAAEASLSGSNPAEAAYLAARLEAAAAKPDLATGRLEKLSQSADCPPHVYAALAEIHLRAQAYDKAQKVLDEGLRAFPSSVRLLTLQSNLYRQTGRADQALESLNKALALEPHRQKLLEELSELRLQRLRRVTNEKDLNREVGELIKVYERILEGREGLERLAPLLVLSSLYQRTDKPERSVEMAKEAVALNPREVRCQLTLAQAQEVVLKDPDAALQTYKQVLLLDPANQEARQRIEKLTEATGRPEEKIKLYADLAQTYPADKQLQELYVKILIREKRWAEAEARLKEALVRWPDDVSGRIALLRVWVAMGRIDDAVAAARKIAEKDRKLAPLAALAVAEALAAQGDRPRAQAVLTEFQKTNPSNENITMALASMLVDTGQTGQAGKVLEDFHRQRPDFFLASVLLAQIYADQKRYQDAQTLLDSQPDSVKQQNKEDLLHLQGELYRRQKNWDKALAILEQLIREHNDNAQYYIEAGTIYQETGRNGEAEKHYLQALKLDPEDPEAYNTLGYFYADTNQKLDEALKLVNKALTMKPGAGHILDSLGWIYYRRGDFNTAAEKLNAAVRAMAKAPDSVVYSHLGDVYEKLGKIKEAREAWQKALTLDAGAADVKEKLSRAGK